ncbi:MAG: hypothetical protein RSA66_07845 [Muribaculaceae bacterium]
MEKKTNATPEGEVKNTQQIEEQVAMEIAAKEAEAKAVAGLAEKEAAKKAEELAAKKVAEKAAKAAAKLAAGEKTGEDGISKEAQHILADYPHENEVFMTSDGFGFFDEHDAIQHAKRLDDQDVVSVKRQEE